MKIVFSRSIDCGYDLAADDCSDRAKIGAYWLTYQWSEGVYEVRVRNKRMMCFLVDNQWIRNREML